MDISQAQDSKVRVPPPLMSRYPGALSAMAVAIPAITAILLVLAINRIQTTQLESDAVTRGRTWSSALLGTLESVDTVFGGGELSRKDRATIALASRIGGLEKFIIFNADGVAIAASDPADIGSVNRSDYWTNQVLRGGVHATIERQAAGETTGGSAKAAMVVAETYVPVFAPSDAGRHVIGAFETYLDVTESARSYERIGFYASAAGIALIAAAAAIALAFARRTQAYRREREAMLAAERQTAESANRAKSAFLATVSHEIRTPMTGILATIELLEGSGLSESQKTMAGIVRRSATSLLGLLNQLLDQSKIEAGKLDIHPRPFLFAGPVTAVVELFSSAAAAKGLTLTAHIDDGIPEAVVGDSGRIEQILVNLVGNALKFTETGGIALQAAATDGGERVRIDVRDTGIGISSDAIARLFDPFEQADPSTTRRFGGTGLGLTVSRQLAELMGGTLTAWSQPGQGSTFSLELPLPATKTQAAVVLPSRVAPSPGLRVLVAEDDATLRWVIGQQLERLGCSVHVVGDGAAAIAEWHADPDAWDLIVTDWHMPELDGLGLLQVLTGSDRAHPPVLMLTASGLPKEIETARRAGASQVLVKPVQMDALAVALAAAERGSRQSMPSPDPVLASDPSVSRGPGEADGEETPLLDTSDLEALTGGDRTMVDHLLLDFAERLESDRRRIAGAEASERRAILHALRGAAAAVGAMALSDVCGRLERDGHSVAGGEFERVADASLAVLRSRRTAPEEGQTDG